MLRKRIKVPVAVQQVVPTLNAMRGDYCIDGLANGHAELAEGSEVPRRLNCDSLAAQLHGSERRQQLRGSLEISFVREALENLGQNQVPDS